MIEPRWLLLGLLLPCAIAGGSVWLLMRCQGKPAPGRRWVCGVSIIGITIAIAVGMFSLTGLPPWKPIVNLHWILMAILPAALMVALLGLYGRVPGWLVWALRLVVACGTAPLLTYSLVPYTWSKPEAAAWWVGLGLWIGVLWFLMHRLATHGRGQLVVFILGGTCGAVGGVTIASGYLTGGQYAASLAFVLLGVWLVMLLCRINGTAGSAIVDLSIAPLGGWLIYNWQYGWTMQNDASPFVVAGLLAVAPLGAWVCRLPVLKNKSRRQQTAVAVLAGGLMLAFAVGLAGYEAMQRVQETSSGYGY